jgi:hypothetical protein
MLSWPFFIFCACSLATAMLAYANASNTSSKMERKAITTSILKQRIARQAYNGLGSDAASHDY